MSVAHLEGIADSFFGQGYAVVQSLFSARQVEVMRAQTAVIEAVGADLRNRGQVGEHWYHGCKIYVKNVNGSAQLHRANWVGNTSARLLALSRDSRLTAIIAHLLGSDQADHLLNNIHFKPPYGGEAFALHQDCTHRRYGDEGSWTDPNGRGSYVQAIAAIDACTPENGTIYFQPFGDLEVLSFPATLEAQEKQGFLKNTVPATLAPGDVVFFGPFVPHWSPENRSSLPRRVLVNGFAYPGANLRTFDIPRAGERISLT